MITPTDEAISVLDNIKLDPSAFRGSVFIDKEIIMLRKTGKSEFPVELILYFGLVDSFPCLK